MNSPLCLQDGVEPLVPAPGGLWTNKLLVHANFFIKRVGVILFFLRILFGFFFGG
jgi:hypothetical protein